MSGDESVAPRFESRSLFPTKTLEQLTARGESVELQPGGFRVVSVGSYSSSSASSTERVELPDKLESPWTLRVAGLTREVANKVYQRVQELREADPIMPLDLVDEACGYVQAFELTDRNPGLEHWDGQMQEMGIAAELRQAMLKPGHDDVRNRYSLKEWLVQTFQERDLFLRSFSEHVDERTQADNQEHGGAGGPRQGHRSQPSQTAPAGRIVTPEGPPSRAIRPASTSSVWSGSQVSVGLNEREARPDEILLFKGGNKKKLQDIIDSPGALVFSRSRAAPPTDFGGESTVYLAKQRRVAWQYASWAQTRHETYGLGAGILSYALPRTLLNDPYEVYADEWRDVVWYSRTDKHEDLFPDRLAHTREQAILVGPICKMDTKYIKDKRKAGHSSATIEAWRLDGGETATQYCFRAPVFREMERHCRIWYDETHAQVRFPAED